MFVVPSYGISCGGFLGGIDLSRAQAADVKEMAALDVIAWGEAMAATPSKLLARIHTFPDGQVVAKSGNRLLGFVNSQKISGSIRYLGQNSTWPAVTGHGFIDEAHKPSGSVLFLINLTVDFKINDLGLSRSGVGAALIKSILELARNDRIRLVEGITRLNGLRAYLQRKSASTGSFADITEYIERVKKKEIRDPALSFHLDQGAEVVGPIKNAMPGDEDSLQWGALIAYQIRDPKS